MSQQHAPQAPTPIDAPAAQGLYDPTNEHDACGVGFVAHIKGQKAHAIVEQGLKILHVAYRGAGPAMNDVLSGQVGAMVAELLDLPYVTNIRPVESNILIFDLKAPQTPARNRDQAQAPARQPPTPRCARACRSPRDDAATRTRARLPAPPMPARNLAPAKRSAQAAPPALSATIVNWPNLATRP